MDADGRGATAEDRLAPRARLLAVLRARAAEVAAAEKTTAVDTGCSIGVGCTVLTIIIMLVGITVIVLTRW
jgi:hypothetical protein